MQRQAAQTLIDALAATAGIVAVVGAGGKKSTLYRLLEAHRALGGRRIALTSTVQIATAPAALGIETLIVDQPGAERAIAATEGRDGAWLIAGPSAKRGRFSGLAGDLVPRLHRRGAFAVSLVKADGARMRMIKAPGADEPALPGEVSTILPIVSARVFGRPLTDKLAHRPERLIEVTGAEIGTEITPRHVARLISSPDGALRRAEKAAVVPIINMVDGPGRLAPAREAAIMALAATDRFERVVLASMTGPSPLIEVITR